VVFIRGFLFPFQALDSITSDTAAEGSKRSSKSERKNVSAECNDVQRKVDFTAEVLEPYKPELVKFVLYIVLFTVCSIVCFPYHYSTSFQCYFEMTWLYIPLIGVLQGIFKSEAFNCFMLCLNVNLAYFYCIDTFVNLICFCYIDTRVDLVYFLMTDMLDLSFVTVLCLVF